VFDGAVGELLPHADAAIATAKMTGRSRRMNPPGR
jgi:hypothetical protein